MGRTPKPIGHILNVRIIDHYAGFISFQVETPWDGIIDCNIRGKRPWNYRLQEPDDLTYDENFGVEYWIDHGQPEDEDIPCSEKGIEMIKVAAKKLAGLCIKTNHMLKMKQYLKLHPKFMELR